MSMFPLLVVLQAFILSTWAMIMLAAFLVTREDEADDYADGVDFTARTIVPD